MRVDTAPGLEIRLDRHGARMRLTVVGDIEGANVATFARVIDDACTTPMDVDVDLAAVGFIAAAGLEELHRAYRRRRLVGRQLRVGPMSPAVAGIFARLGHPCTDGCDPSGLVGRGGGVMRSA
jgi:anti-anti-sigma factor